MSKFTGNIIRLPAVTPTQNSASGVYTLDDQFTAQSSGTWPIVRDQYFNYTTLLLTGAVQGTAYPNPVTQPYSFLSDASTNNFVVSPNGDVSARPFNPYLNNYSAFFDGTNDYCSLAGSADFSIPTSTTPFTVEAWIYPASASALSVIWTERYNGSGNTVSLACGLMDGSSFWTPGRYLGFAYYNGSGWTGTASNAQVELNTWSHVAYVFTGSACKIFLNGLDVTKAGGPTTWAITGVSGEAWYIGAVWDAGIYFNGYISNLRYVVGTAVYTSNFTPSTTPLQNITNTKLLACQSNRFIDNSSSPKTITPLNGVAVSQNSPFVSYDTTNGSGYFDGTGDYLAVLDNAALDMGSSDFTIEGWVYLTSSGASQTFIAKGTGSDSQASYHIVFNGTNWLYYLSGNGSTWSIASGVLMGAGVVNAWQHLALVRNGNTFTPYINGTAGTTTNSATALFDSNKIFSIGADDPGNQRITGYISNVRVVKGTAIAPPAGGPTAPLQAVTNTSLLTLQTRAPATNNGFIDSSPNNFVVTRNGNTTQGSFSPFSPTGWGNYFGGSGNYLQAASSSGFDYGSNSFTIESFVYITSFASNGTIIGTRTGDTSSSINWVFFTASTGELWCDIWNTSNVRIGNFAHQTALQLNAWQHVALVRNGTDFRLYVNGVQSTSSATSSTAVSNSNLSPTIGQSLGGSFGGNNAPLVGYISNLRVVKSQALYTGNFTPPTAALTTTSVGTSGTNVATSLTGNVSLLTCQLNRFRDASPNNLTITVTGSPSVQAFSPFAPAQSYIPSQIGGSGYFDGSDYLSAPDNDAWHFGTGDFTIEAWYYPTTTNSQQIIVAQSTAAGGGTGLSWQLMTSNDSNVYLRALVSSDGSGWVFDLISTSKLQINAWNHVAFVRSGTAFQLYLNGAAATNGSATSSAALYNTTTPLTVGASNAPNQYVTGYMAGVRIVKGTAVYSGTTYTVPTAPLTAIPNTSLLLNFTNGGIVDATGKNNLETVANSGVQTSQAKWSPGSMYFDGNGDRVTMPGGALLTLGSGDFTVEAWVYKSASNAYMTLGGNWTSAGENTWQILADATGNKICWFAVNSFVLTSSATLNTNTWYYIAFVRSGSSTNNFKLYINGSLDSQATMTTDFNNTVRPLFVGHIPALDAGRDWNGYVDDFRITKGIARTITASPTGPFPLG